MSFLTRLFKKADEEDYETVLSTLATDIQNRRVKLSEIRLRERRSTLLVTLYTLAAWVAYVSFWYTGFLPEFSARVRGYRVGSVFRGAPVVIGPIVILFIRRIVQIWYKRKGDQEEKTLRALMKQQRLKLDEIKKKTNYYSMRELIARYDEPASPSVAAMNRRAVPQTPSTPQPRIHVTAPAQGPGLQTPSPRVPGQLIQSPLTLPPTGPPRKQWYDKLADALLGDDDHPSAATTQYALICESCFAHNGLVKESLWEDTQYLCPKCNHFNPSPRAKRERSTRSVSPSSTPSKSPTAIPSQSTAKSENSMSAVHAVHNNGDLKVSSPETSMMEVDDDS